MLLELLLLSDFVFALDDYTAGGTCTDISSLKETNLLRAVLFVDLVAPRAARMNWHHKLSWPELHHHALLVNDPKESLLTKRLEEDMQVQLRQEHFHVSIARFLPHMIESFTIDQGQLGLR